MSGGRKNRWAKGDDDFSLPFEELIEGRFLLGSPDPVAEQIINYNRRLGVNVIVPASQWVGTQYSQVLEALHLFAEEVMPKVRGET